MGWFDILKISFKPVDRDRPAPKIKLTEGLEGEEGSYNSTTGVTNISPNPNVTPEELADTLAHESTHEAQFKTEPILREILDGAQDTLVALILTVSEIPLEDLTTEVISELLEDVELGLGSSLKLYLEQDFSIEAQAYSLERNFETTEDRQKFVHLLLNSFEEKIVGLFEAVGVEDKKISLVMDAVNKIMKPLFIRILKTFVRRGSMN